MIFTTRFIPSQSLFSFILLTVTNLIINIIVENYTTTLDQFLEAQSGNKTKNYLRSFIKRESKRSSKIEMAANHHSMKVKLPLISIQSIQHFQFIDILRKTKERNVAPVSQSLERAIRGS